jgi:lysophospholipase L1-like esterase
MSPRRGARDLATKIALALASLVVLFAALEVGFRLAGFGAIYDVYSKPSVLWRHDDLLGWAYEPNASVQYVGPRPWPVEFSNPVRINSLGLRGPEPSPRGDAELRVLVSGDSLVAGFEVPYPETFTALLQEELSRRLGRAVAVLNAGVRGYGTDQSYLYYRERLSQLEPDLVVFLATANDPLNNVTVHRMRRPFGKGAFRLSEGGDLELTGTPVPRYPLCSEYRLDDGFELVRLDALRTRSVCGLQLKLADHSALFTYVALALNRRPQLVNVLYRLGAPRRQGGAAPPSPEPQMDPKTRLTGALLEAFARDAHANGSRMMIVLQREGIGVPEDQRDAEGDALVTLPETTGEPEVQFQRDSHWNALGHRRVADFLAPLLEKELRQVLQSR